MAVFVTSRWWRGPYDLIAANGSLTRWIGLVTRQLAHPDEKEFSHRDLRNLPPGRSAELVELIRQHLGQPLTVQKWAELAGCSRRTLNDLMRNDLERTAHEVLDQLRIDRAHELLHSTDSLEQVAHGIGFASGDTLTRWFRKLTGQTPAEWRKSLTS